MITGNNGGNNGDDDEALVSVDNVMFGVSVSAHYARKFDMSVESSSSIAARIVSLPAPDAFFDAINTINEE